MFWVAVTLVFGLGGSVGFFVWAEGSIVPPELLRSVGCPWATISWDWPPARMLINILLVWLFGALHSAMAQVSARDSLERVVGLDAVRAAYVSLTGLSLMLVIGFWQPVGLVIWRISWLDPWTHLVTRGLYLIGILASITVICAPRPLEFWGVTPLFGGSQSGPGQGNVLKTDGMYGIVRHPGYAALVLALGAAPLMTADRLVMFVAVVTYLMVAIPIEEAKLARIFGAPYDAYRRRVPALLPFLRQGGFR